MTIDISLSTVVDSYWLELKKAVVESGLELQNVEKAFLYSEKAHFGQRRESGEPYISHPVWVAKVMAQLEVGEEAVMAALLHDCVEDTSVTVDDIAMEFGDEIALLVSGLTEVKKKTHGIEVHKTNIEVFRNFLFSSVNDVRVLIIRLVDKLHNGLTVGYLPKERQIKFAKRVFGIYGPVAEYVGLHYFKRVLEDIAYRILYPKSAKRLEIEIEKNSKEERVAMAKIIGDIEKMMKINNIHEYEIQSRIKSLYSSHLKVSKYGLEHGLKDRVGIRVLVKNIADCYTVLGLIHSKYPYIEEEFKDYISSPKVNGYRSIQTTFGWRDGVSVEVQIRTFEMHEFNEFGPASHIAYKLGKNVDGGVGLEWVRDLVKWQKGDNNINNYRINVLERFVYVFTPKGDTIQLPAGSTALDFAYKVHTEIGDRCVGVKINQKMGKIDTVLKTGDYVEILTNKKINANKNWLRFVVTPWAKEHIRKVTLDK